MGTERAASRFAEDIYFEGVPSYPSYRRCRRRVAIGKWRVVGAGKSEEKERPSKGAQRSRGRAPDDADDRADDVARAIPRGERGFRAHSS